ncbi:MAG: GIY-YIG nuclease family protein [bacterium]
MWYVYILKCRNNALYTGITNNIGRRLKEHNSGKGGSYTKSQLPVSLVYSESHGSKSEALKREIQLKGWTKRKKQALIERNYAKLRRLSRFKKDP